MIGTLLRIWWTSLRRDRVAQSMTFVLPIVFFSIFAMVFSGRSGSGTPRVRVAVVDEDHSELSRRLVRGLTLERGLRVQTTRARAERDTTRVPLARADAEALVRSGEVPVAIVLPAGLDSSFARFDAAGAPVQLLADPADPVAAPTVGGLLQKVTMTSAPDVLARSGLTMFDRNAGHFTAEQRRSMDRWLSDLHELVSRPADQDSAGGSVPGPGGGGAFSDLLRVEQVNVVGPRQGESYVAYYAAAIAVMFLLFMSSSGGGSLLDEVDSGTLERVLGSNVGMTGLLAGKWIYLTLLGMLQISVMLLWGRLVFHLELSNHVPGLALMTIFTAATAASFGLVLATACRTRAQLGGISTITILVLSALGGSMMPRPLMPEAMQRVGLLLFNGQALEGYLGVFWRDASLVQLLPHVAVLAAYLVVFLTLARLLARRWETA